MNKRVEELRQAILEIMNGTPEERIGSYVSDALARALITNHIEGNDLSENEVSDEDMAALKDKDYLSEVVSDGIDELIEEVETYVEQFEKKVS